jgi:hypothetical protein
LEAKTARAITHITSTTRTIIRKYFTQMGFAVEKRNIPTFMSLTWLQWRYQLQKASTCVVGEALDIPHNIPKTATNVTELDASFYITLHLIGEKGWN